MENSKNNLTGRSTVKQKVEHMSQEKEGAKARIHPDAERVFEVEARIHPDAERVLEVEARVHPDAERVLEAEGGERLRVTGAAASEEVS